MTDTTEAILLRLGLDASGFSKGTRQAKTELGSLEKGVDGLKDKLGEFAAVAAAGLGLVELTKSALEFAESVTRVHQQTGLAVEDIQFLRLAADLTGGSVDNLATLVNKMQRQLVEVGTNTKLHEQLANIGIDVEELRKLGPADQLQAMAEAIANIKDPAEQATAAVLAFGKSGAEALPQIKALAEQQTELHDAFIRTGGAVSGNTIDAVHGLGDAFTETKTAVVALATELLGGVAPAFKSFLETVTEVVAGLRLLDGQGDNAMVNLDSSILRLQDSIASFKKNNPFPDEFGKQYLANLESQLAAVTKQYDELANLGAACAAKQKADKLATALAVEKAISDGTLAEVQVRVQHETDAHFQIEAEELAHQQRKMDIIGAANRSILDEDTAFHDKLVEHANLGSIAEQDVLHGGLTALEQFQADSWDNQVATVAGGLEKMTAGIAQHSKAAFEVNKAAAIVNTVVQTIQAVTKAWADYGWPYGAIMGAAIAAAGALQVSAIKSTTFKGGGGGIAPSNATTPAQPTAPAGNGAQGSGGVLRVEGLSADSVLSGASAQALAQKLLEFQKDGGQVVFQP